MWHHTNLIVIVCYFIGLIYGSNGQENKIIKQLNDIVTVLPMAAFVTCIVFVTDQ